MSGTESRFVDLHLLELYRELRALTVPAERIEAAPPTAAVLEMWRSGIPLLYCHPPQLDGGVFFQAMEAIGEILKKHHPERAEEFDRIIAALPADAEERARAVRDILRRDGEWLERTTEEHKLPDELMGLMLNLTLQPFLRHYSAALRGHLDLERWYKGYCPVCGGNPNFSRLSKVIGKRYLYCSLCETEWPFARIACPFCKQSEEGRVRYFTVDDDERYRVYVCDRCRGYIKAVDESKTGHNEHIELFWEDVKTVHLDLLALREGYENKITEIPEYGEEVKN